MPRRNSAVVSHPPALIRRARMFHARPDRVDGWSVVVGYFKHGHRKPRLIKHIEHLTEARAKALVASPPAWNEMVRP